MLLDHYYKLYQIFKLFSFHRFWSGHFDNVSLDPVIMHDDISFIICLFISSVLSISPFQINRVQSLAGFNMASTIVQYILVRGDLLLKERGSVSCLRREPVYCTVAGFGSLQSVLGI
jgi:hypothetical protein